MKYLPGVVDGDETGGERESGKSMLVDNIINTIKQYFLFHILLKATENFEKHEDYYNILLYK